MKNKTLIKIIIIYLLFLAVGITFSAKAILKLYNNPVIIDDRKETLDYLKSSQPVKIEVSDARWGSETISDRKDMAYIKIMLDSIKKSNKQINSKLEGKISIAGTIYYLNESKEQFYIPDINLNKIYNGNVEISSRTEIRQLSSFLSYKLITPEKLSNIINDKNEVIISNVDGNKMRITIDEKNQLKKLVKNSIKLHDYDEIRESLEQKGELLYHIKIINENSGIKNNIDLINVDIYSNNYFIVSDMFNENGTLVYMKGDLEGFCKKLLLIKK